MNATPSAGTVVAVTQPDDAASCEAGCKINDDKNDIETHDESHVPGPNTTCAQERAPSPITGEMLLEQKRQQRKQKQNKQHKQRSGSRSKRRPKASTASDDHA